MRAWHRLLYGWHIGRRDRHHKDAMYHLSFLPLSDQRRLYDESRQMLHQRRW